MPLEPNLPEEPKLQKLTHDNLLSLAYFDDKPLAVPRFAPLPHPDQLFALDQDPQDPSSLYRKHGHHAAKLNPLGGFLSAQTEQGRKRLPSDSALKALYSGTLACEADHLSEANQAIFYSLYESLANKVISKETKLHLALQTLQAEEFENYLAKKFPGVKRFGLEGSDTLVTLLDSLLHAACDHQLSTLVLSMPHRGRLNVLSNIMTKPLSAIASELAESNDFQGRTGDVKYHMGYQAQIKLKGQTLDLFLANNPSHLEAVVPVANGMLRALQENSAPQSPSSKLGIHMHGDASFVGQGIVLETLQASQTPTYSTQGSIHIIVNNQVGFTLQNETEARSTPYPSDLIKGFGIPVLHVNADDPEATYRAAHIALAYRQATSEDVLIHHIGYRRNGHNETDDPTVTSPSLYKLVKKQKTASASYLSHLVNEKVLAPLEVDALHQKVQDLFKQGEVLSGYPTQVITSTQEPYQGQSIQGTNTKASPADVQSTFKLLTKTPPSFQTHRVLQKVLESRLGMSKGDRPLDWGAAEMLAFGTLALEGIHTRLTGQDSRRGTFSHRQSRAYDQNTEAHHDFLAPLNKVKICDAYLSENAVLSFEYGLSSQDPKRLVIWEAQFGDFANVAQVVFDQFISSAEQKWNQLSSLVCLLPHGMEGQGPEHSSARIERFLQLCAQDNMQVFLPSTPAQIFHIYRTQVHASYRKPAIVFSPKSLLRHPKAVSKVSELTEEQFQPLIDDSVVSPSKVKRVVFCSGKLYYDLLEARGDDLSIALVRLERLYPVPEAEIKASLAHYTKAQTLIWAQEESLNQGMWLPLIQPALIRLGIAMHPVSRDACAAPAVGHRKTYLAEQKALIDKALNGSFHSL